MTADTPFVSVVIPIRNEAGFIAELIDAVFAQDYPADRMEVIVADGQSTDGTRDILVRLQARYPRLTVLDNPGRIVPTALNLAIARARGDVIVRIDGHTVIASDFIRQDAALLAEHPEAWCVGGPIHHAGTSTFGRAVAVAMSHPLGVGNARHHFANYEGYVDGTAFPAFRRWVFDRVGLFDEHLVRNQDDEFNFRMQQAGGKVFVSPRVQYRYFVRGRIGQLFRQYFQYGFWRIPVIAKHRRPTTVRQLAPTLFHVACVLLAIAAIWSGRPWLGVWLPGLYVAALLMVGVASIPQQGLSVGARVPLAIATMHAGYGWGMAYGLWSRLFRPNAWEAQGRMAAMSR